MLRALGYKPWETPERHHRIGIAKRLYCKQGYNLDTIAKRVGVYRGTICRWAKLFGWEKFQRKTSVRTRYRLAAETKLGRRLKPYEHVHHVDGNCENNAEENLHVYPDAKSHSIGHQSLHECALMLFSHGEIAFDSKKGKYFLW